MTHQKQIISVLPGVSKFFERLMHKQINFHTDQCPLPCVTMKTVTVPNKHSFLIEKWKKVLDNKGHGGAILMDLSKAFITINHYLYIAKLHVYGFSKELLKQIKSYLTNR